MNNIDDKYLGDGVYASFDGYHVTLDLRGQDDTTKIALEPSVYSRLVEYVEYVNAQVALAEKGRYPWYRGAG